MLTNTERRKLLAELHADDRRCAEAMHEAYRRNAEANAAGYARRHPDNDLRRDEENENGVAEERLVKERGWDDEPC